VGNLHGRYPVPRQLDLDLLAEIGVGKINLDSDLRYAYRTTLERRLREYAIVRLMGPVVRAVRDVVEEHIEVYGSAGRAR
jgi:fructose-bisphosphate aldolase class II